MVYFLHGFHLDFFNQHFKNLKKKDTQTKTSGYMSRHISIVCYIIYTDLKQMQESYVDSKSFKTYFDQKALHQNNKKNFNFLYEVLSSNFFKMSMKTFQKNFN